MTAKKSRGGARVGAGRPPTRFAYDPRTIPGLRDQGRARAAQSIPEMIELAERMLRVGLGVLRAVDTKSREGTGTVDAEIGTQLSGKITETNRDDQGDRWTNQTVEERRPFGGLEWDDVRWAADYLSDRCGFSRRAELDVSAADIPPKLYRLTTYRGKDGVRRELPGSPSGDPPGS